MFTDILWRFLVIETFVLGAVFSTTCIFSSPQKQFCTSEFVLAVDFLNTVHLSYRYAFTANVLQVLKGNLTLLNNTGGQYVNVVTTDHLHFAVGKQFFIFGNNRNGSLYTESCDRPMPLEYTIGVYNMSVRGYYKDNCSCVALANANRICRTYITLMKQSNWDCQWVIPSVRTHCADGKLDMTGLTT